MTLKELNSPEDLSTFQTTNPNTLICFSATWCGPCQRSKPQLEALASKYHNDPDINLMVGLGYEENLGDSIQQYGVRAFPTYVLFSDNGKKEVGRISGVDFAKIEDLVNGCSAIKDKGFGSGEGQSLGGSGTTLSPAEARAKFLAKFGAASPSQPKNVDEEEDTKPASTPQDVEMKIEPSNDEAPPAADDSKPMEIDDNTCVVVPDGPEMVDPTKDLSPELLQQLTEVMGFPLIRAQKALLNGGKNVDGAVEWLLQHQDDKDIDDPIKSVPKSAKPGAVAMSYKCNECGKILSNMGNLELHANKTGHSDFEESTQQVKLLSAEEKAAKVIELKKLLQVKRAERQDEEKKQNVVLEQQRRSMGQQMGKTREQMAREKMSRDAKMRKKAKIDALRERERIRAELAKDKAERKANKGKLGSRIGVNGYAPDGIQYDVETKKDETDAKPGVAPQKVDLGKNTPSTQKKIEEYIQKISSYRAGGDGGKCLKVLKAYVGNVAEKDDEKYRTIKTDNNAYKTKIKPFLGAKQLLLLVGFSQGEHSDTLVLSPDADKCVLVETKAKLEAAFAAY